MRTKYELGGVYYWIQWHCNKSDDNTYIVRVHHPAKGGKRHIGAFGTLEDAEREMRNAEKAISEGRLQYWYLILTSYCNTSRMLEKNT